jgi:hypothetical protein
VNKECVRHCNVMFDSRTNAWENRVHDIKVKVFTRTFIKVSLWVPSLYWSDFYLPLLSILEPDWADSSSSESCLGVEIELLANRTQVSIDFWLRAVMLTPVYRWFIFLFSSLYVVEFHCYMHVALTWIWSKRKWVQMGGNVTSTARVLVDVPSATDIFLHLQDGRLDTEFLLKLNCRTYTTESIVISTEAIIIQWLKLLPI